MRIKNRITEVCSSCVLFLHAAVACLHIVGACGAQQPQAPSLSIGAVLFEPVPSIGTPQGTFAASVAFLDDLDGDGRSEVLIGSPSAGLPNGNVSGAGNLTAHSSMGLAPIYQINGPTAPEQAYGLRVTVVGDINFDGIRDIASLTSTSAQVGALPPSIQLRSGATGSLLYAITYPNNVSNLITFDRMRDVNGDGVDDLIVGDADAGAVQIRSGASSGVIAGLFGVGGFEVSTLGDIDGDGIDDVHCSGQSPSGQVGYVLRYSAGQLTIIYQFGASNYTSYGARICGAGDFDFDGCDDFLVAGPGNSLTPALPIELRSGATGQILKSLINPGTPTNRFGIKMIRVGDIDGDGFGEVAVTAPWESYGSSVFIGATYIYSGASFDLVFEVPGFLSVSSGPLAVSGGGDFNGDGLGDIVVGQPQSGAGYLDFMCVYLGSPVFNADAARGTVNQSGAGVVDVLGAAAPGAAQPEYGGLGRTLVLPAGNAVDFWLSRPPGHTSLTANHLIFGKLETAATFTTFGLPLGLGNLAFAPSLADPSNPNLFILCSTWGVPAALQSIPAYVGGPGAVVASTPPIPVPMSLLVQGLVEDSSAGAVPLAVTNLMRVVVR